MSSGEHRLHLPLARRDDESGVELTLVRPKTRGDCADGPRPCPWASCHHHLLIDSFSAKGEPRLAFDDIDEMTETCALDVAERGGVDFTEIGPTIGLNRERARQVANAALEKLDGVFDLDITDFSTGGGEHLSDFAEGGPQEHEEVFRRHRVGDDGNIESWPLDEKGEPVDDRTEAFMAAMWRAYFTRSEARGMADEKGSRRT